MSKSILKSCLLISMLVSLVACGGDEEDNTPPGSTPDSTPDLPDSTPDLPDTTPDLPDTTPEPGDTSPTCDSTPRPARCDADPTTFDGWGPASVISSLVLPPSNMPCCIDFTGDGMPNNALGTIAQTLAGDVDINGTIAESIADGSIAVILEHDGLAALDADSAFSVNFLLGEPEGELTGPDPAGGNLYKINPASLDEGTWPQARAESAKLEGTTVTGGPGQLVLSLSLFGATLNLTVSGVQFTATVDPASSGLPDVGVALTAGELGGFIKLEDLATEINTFVAGCPCVTDADGVPLTGGLLTFTPGDVAETLACVEGADSTSCSTEDERQDICKTLVGTGCGFIPVIGSLADVDSRALGADCAEGAITCDSISIGARFTAAGANINGVAAAE